MSNNTTDNNTSNNTTDNNSDIHDCIIIGAGCAGLTAAIYLARSFRKILVFAGSYEDKGGLLAKTSIVENYPGFPGGILGFDLMVNMEEQAEKYGARVINQTITNINIEFTQGLLEKRFIITDATGQAYVSRTVIIATGSTPNKLSLPNETSFWGRGISSCAVCDGCLYRDRKIMVVGGG